MAGSTAPSSHSAASPHTLHEEPLRGQIWAGSASAILPVLQAAAASTVAGLSVAMQTDKDDLEHADSDTLPTRPCLIIRTYPRSKTAVVVIFTTLGSGLTDITEADRYFQHFAVSVGETPAWPSQDSWVLPTEPRWNAVPQYLSACTYNLPYDSLVGRFRTGVSGQYDCDERSLLKLERICLERAAAFQAKPPDELSTWAASYKISKDRYLARIGTRDSSNGSGTLSLRPASDTTRRYSGPYRPGVNGPSTPCPSLAAQEHKPGRRPAFRPALAMQPISENLALSRGHRAPSLAGPVAAQPRANNRFSILALDSGESDTDDDPDSEPVPSLSHSPDTSSCESSPNMAPRDLESSPASAALSLPDATDSPGSQPRKRLAHEKDKRCPEDVGVPGMYESDHAAARATPLKGQSQSPATAGRMGAGERTCGKPSNRPRYFNAGHVVGFKPSGLGLQMGHGMVTAPRTVI